MKQAGAWLIVSGNEIREVHRTKTAAARALRQRKAMDRASGVKNWERLKKAAPSSNTARKNPTKAERAVKAQKASAKRRVAVALAKYLKQVRKKVVGN